MDWIERLNKAIVCIEENITEEIEYAQLAKIACCSSYQFQRMFSYIAGVPLPEYIRRRKISLAAVDLQSGEKIIDVALKYGYTSPTAFNRAFQSIHGIAPSRA
ncbi:MAG: helix-turn-helix transcriptional regulator, partial [Defluviitaleaceae bacterium]|nr:helix-turn-helix transcriptional regulator [Defluviitaleaceae bacterium]